MWQALIPLIGNVIEKVIPDPAAQAQAKLQALDLAQKGELAALDAELKLALGQIETNKAEAGTDVFRGGWRPACGWACVVGLGYTFLLQPLLGWGASIRGWPVPPAIATDELMVLLTGMLGLGGLRSFEKVRGKA